MTLRSRIFIALLWTLSLIAVRTWAQAPNPQIQELQKRLGGGLVISGSDLGFRVDGSRGDVPIGVVVARINGQWVEVEFASRVKTAR